MPVDHNITEVLDRVNEITGWNILRKRFKLVTDTSEWMSITRGNVIALEDRLFAVRGNMTETRFGIGEQPKYWVFSAVDLETSKEKIIKTEFYEEFIAHIGLFKIRCYRSPQKESDVLDLTINDERFMKGLRILDEKNNNVRVIDYIRGKTFFEYIHGKKKSHIQYFRDDLPEILYNLLDSFKAIQLLHQNNTCHGDIRNDHIIIDSATKKFKWIDFDLKQDVSDFDMWSLGNILSYAVAKGIVTFETVLKNKEIPDRNKRSLTQDDGSAFYQYRIINLKKLYPYIPERLDNLLHHFSIKPIAFYSGIDEFVDDYQKMLWSDFPKR